MNRDDVMETHWTAVDGRKTRVMVAPPAGAGESGERPLRLPLVFIHGLGCDGTVWEPTLREISSRDLCCPAVAPDLPGYGYSHAPRHALWMHELADWTARLMDERGLRRAHLVGNSMGCQVALSLARRHPDRVGAVVVQGPTMGAHVPLARYVGGLALDGFQETLRYNVRLAAMYWRMGPVRYLKTAAKMMRDDAFGHADGVHAPVLVIRGGHDTIVSDRRARALADALPDAEYLPLASAAHAIEFNNPVEFTTAMLDFLQRAERRLLPTPPAACQPPPKTVRARPQRTAPTVASTR
jgi:pimeloyl-ACP methyl ester carboxylesterase